MTAGKRVLVVDDDMGIRVAIALKLRGAGCSVAEATDGVEAMEYLAKNSTDVVVLDVGMPRMNGYEVACALQDNAATRSLPLVILTAQDLEIPENVRNRIGRHRFLTKPFSPRELVTVVTQLLSDQPG